MAKVGIKAETIRKIAAFRKIAEGREYTHISVMQDADVAAKMGKEFPSWTTLRRYGILVWTGKNRWHLAEETKIPDNDEYLAIYRVSSEDEVPVFVQA